MSDREDRQPAVFELRRDPIVGRQVLIAEKRAERPNDFSQRAEPKPERDHVSDCPFCLGHEGDTPESLLEVPGASGTWQVRVVPNKYPAVSLEVEPARDGPFGAHEVIIESPRHVQDITELSLAEFATVLQTYRQRLRYWSTDQRIRHCSIFKNVGIAAGASLEHVHSQLVALPEVPPGLAAELEGAKRYHEGRRSCRFCQLIHDELTHRQRLVVASDRFVALSAYAARQPFEMWIVPRHHDSSFTQLTDADAVELADVLQRLVGALQTQLQPLSYNLVLHTAPYDAAAAEYYHWHFEVVPRSTQLAGFEWGTGIHINPLSPERATAILVEAGQNSGRA